MNTASLPPRLADLAASSLSGGAASFLFSYGLVILAFAWAVEIIILSWPTPALWRERASAWFYRRLELDGADLE